LARADGGAPNLVYVAGAGAGGKAVAIIDIAVGRVTSTVTTDSPPAGIVLSLDGRFAYLTVPELNRVAVVDTNAKRVVATIPVGARPGSIILVPTASATELYVALQGSDRVAIVDANARRVLRTVTVCSQPSSLALAGANSGIADPNDPEVYVACAGSQSIAVIETGRNQIVARVPLATNPAAVVVPATGGAAYVTTNNGTVEAIALARHAALGVIYHHAGARFGTMDYDAVTGDIYVPDTTSDQIIVLTPVAVSSAGGTPSVPREPARVLPVGGSPSAVAITFDGSYGFVAQRADGSILVLDPASHQTLATVPVGGAPTALVTGPYPPVVSGQTAFLVDIAVIGALVALMAIVVVSAAIGARRRRRKQNALPKPE
jgi:YVTN family beta-propeller protein